MNTALNIRSVGPEIKAALQARAKSEGRPMSDIARDLLADALGVKPEHPMEKWKRENADALNAMDRRIEGMYDELSKHSAVPFHHPDDYA